MNELDRIRLVKKYVSYCPSPSNKRLAKKLGDFIEQIKEVYLELDEFAKEKWRYVGESGQESYAAKVDRKHPGVILAVEFALAKLAALNIEVVTTYVGGKSDVIIIETKLNKKEAQRINEQIKAEMCNWQRNGWLIVEHLHMETGDEEEASLYD